MLPFTTFGGWAGGRTTAAAGTAFTVVVPPKDAQAFTRLAEFEYTTGANTAHNVAVLRPIGRANVASAANTSGASLVLDADPSPAGNTIAASDYCVYQAADGTYRAAVVNTSGWASNTKTVTFTANLAANVAAGAKFFMMGVAADTDPAVGTAHPQFPVAANTTKKYTFDSVGVPALRKGDPLLIFSANATDAGVLNYATAGYTRE